MHALEFQSRPVHGSGGSMLDGAKKDFKTVMLGTKMNILLVFLPFAFISANAGWHDAATFILCGIPLISLAERLSFATEELSEYVSGTMAGLLNATFGNAPELILCGFALNKGYVRITQLSLLGSVLGNLLLVTGTAFVVGGIKNRTMTFNKQICMMNMTLLWFGTLCVFMPSVLFDSSSFSPGTDRLLRLSRFISVLMVLAYAGYMVFQMFTHKDLYEEDGDSASDDEKSRCSDDQPLLQMAGGSDDHTIAVAPDTPRPVKSDDEDEDGPSISRTSAVTTMGVVALLIAILSDYLVTSIVGAAVEMNVPLPFLVVILLPIINNASEHSVAIIFAIKNKLEVTMGIVMGSSTQILVLILPFAVLLAWMMGQPMDLNLNTFESWILLMTVILVFFISHDGIANWLRGMILLLAYLAFAAAFWCHVDPLLKEGEVTGA